MEKWSSRLCLGNGPQSVPLLLHATGTHSLTDTGIARQPQFPLKNNGKSASLYPLGCFGAGPVAVMKMCTETLGLCDRGYSGI